jgi:hypothetical protein
MKKVVLMLFVIAAIVVSCNDSNENIQNQHETSAAQEIDMSDFYVETQNDELSRVANNSGKNCHSMNVLNRQLKENPGLYSRMYDVELHTRTLIAGKKGGNGNGNGNGGGGDPEPPAGYAGTVNIPIYVHVIGGSGVENVTDQQINSQISVLNADFNDTNYNDVPAEFQGVAADTDMTFSLAQTFRYTSSTTSWGTNDAVKSAYPPVTPETHLNVWVCNIGGGILGYAQFPGGSLATDGVVILPGTLPGGSAAPYNGGRTLTHEVGHYLNLRHIWGDGRCNRDDFVADTPSSDGANYGCPSYPTVNCRTNDMTMNYMDYTDDACMNMFTDGQNDRMRAIFVSGGARAAMVGN